MTLDDNATVENLFVQIETLLDQSRDQFRLIFNGRIISPNILNLLLQDDLQIHDGDTLISLQNLGAQQTTRTQQNQEQQQNSNVQTSQTTLPGGATVMQIVYEVDQNGRPIRRQGTLNRQNMQQIGQDIAQVVQNLINNGMSDIETQINNMQQEQVQPQTQQNQQQTQQQENQQSTQQTNQQQNNQQTQQQRSQVLNSHIQNINAILEVEDDSDEQNAQSQLYQLQTLSRNIQQEILQLQNIETKNLNQFHITLGKTKFLTNKQLQQQLEKILKILKTHNKVNQNNIQQLKQFTKHNNIIDEINQKANIQFQDFSQEEKQFIYNYIQQYILSN